MIRFLLAISILLGASSVPFLVTLSVEGGLVLTIFFLVGVGLARCVDIACAIAERVLERRDR